MPGTIVTFYSFKGGVGRSLAVANIAAILAQWGSRVLVVDWDIEAPGLNHYFAPYLEDRTPGVLNFLADCEHAGPRPWNVYAGPVVLPDGVRGLSFMPAAADDGTDYTERVQRLNWDLLYDEHALGTALEALRAGWLEHFDLVLIDSRTGVTDFSGALTVQLPDVLAFLFTANAQSLDGCADIAERAMEARRKLPLDRHALMPLPIPARFEQREEYERAQEWRRRFASRLSPFLDLWTTRGTDVLKLIDLLTIPYVPRWSFGEELAAVLEPAGTSGARTAGQAVSYALETIAALLVQQFAKVDLLVSCRDEYVHSARATVAGWRSGSQGSKRVFLSYSKGDEKAALEISEELQAAGFGTWIAEHEIRLGDRVEEALRQGIEETDAYLVVISPSFSRSQQAEVEVVLRQSLRSDRHKPIIPVILPGGEEPLARSRLSDFKFVSFDPGEGSIADQLKPAITRLGKALDEV